MQDMTESSNLSWMALPDLNRAKVQRVFEMAEIPIVAIAIAE